MEGNGWGFEESLRIQVCPKKGINPTVLLWGWDWDHQSYSREGSGCLGNSKSQSGFTPLKTESPEK